MILLICTSFGGAYNKLFEHPKTVYQHLQFIHGFVSREC